MKSYDRKLWGDGPWDGEPDRVEWKVKGLPALIVRSDLGNLCGYVAVPPGHPSHGKDYDLVDVNVHGGLTYAGACSGEICHKVAKGEPDDVWWLGFDCGHAWDLIPYMVASHGPWLFGEGATYKTVEYVQEECEKLAAQLRRLAMKRVR